MRPVSELILLELSIGESLRGAIARPLSELPPKEDLVAKEPYL